MINYPVRCVCFALVGLLFLLPVVFLVVTVNQPKAHEHVHWRETNCTLASKAFCYGGEEVECVTFELQSEDAKGKCDLPCEGSGALNPLKRDDELLEGDTTKCYYLIEGLTMTENNCTITNGQLPPNCGSLSNDVYNDGVDASNDPTYTDGDRPRRQVSGFVAPPGCVYVNHDGVDEITSDVTFANNGTVTVRCISNTEKLLERLDYGGLAILLEGFFVTFSIICFIGVGLATFVEKTPNNDAYCFNFRL